ncbi:MAG: hypothetical protein Q7U54_01380 [Bacteroidales bacterium]|nr:hypothetical protein [Bacteroidales bacterium]
MKALIFFLLLILAVLPSFAQTDGADIEIDNSTDGKGWIFGLNVGVYYPSKKTAAFYNGDSKNINNVNYVMSNYYLKQQILELLNENAISTTKIEVANDGLPQNMHYKLALQPGLYAQYCFNSKLSLIIEFNYMKLKANDVIVFELDSLTYATNSKQLLCPIRGVEERVYADIGLKRTYLKSEKLSYYVMGGLNVNSTKVKKSSFYVLEQEFDMIDHYNGVPYVPNSGMQTFEVYQGGIGVGMFAGAGAALNFNGIVIEPGITAHWLMVNLDGYQNMNPGIGANVRFMF